MHGGRGPKAFHMYASPAGGSCPPSRPFGRQLPRWGSHGGVAPCPRPAVGEGLAPPVLRALPRRRKFKETLIKSRCSDLRQKFSLARKKSAGILCVFQTFLTKTSGDLCREDGRGDLFRGSLNIPQSAGFLSLRQNLRFCHLLRQREAYPYPNTVMSVVREEQAPPLRRGGGRCRRSRQREG